MEFEKKLYVIRFEAEGQLENDSDDGPEDKFDDGADRDHNLGAADAKNGDTQMGEEKTPDRERNSGSGNKDQSHKKGSQLQGGKTVPMWTSLFKEPTWDRVFAEELNEMVGINLLRSMELEDSEMADSETDREEDVQMDEEAEEFGLPEDLCEGTRNIADKDLKESKEKAIETVETKETSKKKKWALWCHRGGVIG